MVVYMEQVWTAAGSSLKMNEFTRHTHTQTNVYCYSRKLLSQWGEKNKQILNVNTQECRLEMKAFEK